MNTQTKGLTVCTLIKGGQSMSKAVAASQPCPKCNSSDSLAIYPDGTGFCWSNCGYLSKGLVDGSGEKTYSKPAGRTMSRWNIEEVGEFPYADLSSRGINDE